MRSTSPQPQVASRGRRVFLALAAVFCVAVQAAAIAHVDFGAHGVCPEHGELTELVAQPQAAGPHAALDPHPNGVAGLHVPAAALTQVDDHCLLAELARQIGPVHAAALPVRVSVAWTASRARAVQVAEPASWLLHLAPKQSPPA